ncbi:MAG: TIGR00299 family protein [Solidesulfovibrio magneticus str. Maddingley MBC34]|uniref:Putative nickel insertion protein n=1 Tax=Solidesulfovibrio magneticus str. Maddingley MBC34 TaxID=1206767 RepID=K6FQZ3_9BACT|nr:MAG: TIGR00299 family protein [Solidesulfovibrio magneticus str. Maddingley MBC34]
MKILFYDCFAGVSGDMNLAAMLGLGVSPDFLGAELSKLGLDDEFRLEVGKDARNGIHGLRVDVRLTADDAAGEENGHGGHHGQGPAQAERHTHEPGRDHAHDTDHGHGEPHPHDGHHHHGHAQAKQHAHHHGREPVHPAGHDHGGHHEPGQEHVHGSHDHGHGHGHGHDGSHGHAPHRNLAAIEAVIRGSSLSEPVKDTSLAIFRKVAQAEAKVHGKLVDEVHFHEVGAVDSIVDIVGAAICFHALGVDAVWASPVELGGGFARCAHGLMPVPAPATTEILAGVPTTRGGTPHEATTPTGAAILATLATRFTATPALTLEQTAYGIGHRQTERPNVLRVHLATAEAPDASAPQAKAPNEARLLVCNIDDMTAEALGVAMDVLMEHGAMDVHFTPILMKKNRPGTTLSLLCAADDEERFKDLIFRHTATLGVKVLRLEKTELDRTFSRLETPLGPVTMKHAARNGVRLRSKPELEDCRELAKHHGLSLAEVQAVVAGCAGRGEKP